MRWLWIPFLALALLRTPVHAAPECAPPPIDGKALFEHVKWLSADEREGRAAGAPGAWEAGEYIASHFRELGLEPAGDDGSYFQTFDLPRGFEVGAGTCVEAARGSRTTKVEVGDELSPVSLSGAGDVRGPAVFCGYGVSAPDLGYDDYAGVDVQGCVVVVLRHAPGMDDRKSPFSNPVAQRRHATFQAKVDTAVAAGALAILIVNDPAACWKPKDDTLLANVGGKSGKIPVLHLTYRAGRRLAKTMGVGLQKEQRAIDGRRAPRSKRLDGVELHVVADLVTKTLPVRNVCARLRAPGETQEPRETLLLGGHFDHLGFGEYGSRAGSKGKGVVHNGADDNATGTAMVMELAGFLAARRERLRRDVLFVLFTGEELGLLGSKHYVEKPIVPLAQTIAMLNFDMVGRLERGTLQVGGTGTSPVFPELLDAANEKLRIQTRYNPGGQAPSDNAPFYEKNIPVLFFFTGLHKDYHRPKDDWNLVDRRGLAKIAELAARVCLELATCEQRPPFARADGSALSMGPHLGLAVEQRDDGVYVIGVERGSPAAKVGFKVDDRIEEFDGQGIRTTADFNEAHSRAKPRSRVTLTVRRGRRLIDLEPKLGRR